MYRLRGCIGKRDKRDVKDEVISSLSKGHRTKSERGGLTNKKILVNPVSLCTGRRTKRHSVGISNDGWWAKEKREHIRTSDQGNNE